MNHFLKQIAVSSFAIALAGLLCAKTQVMAVTISGGELPKPIEITEPNVIRSFDIWSGPGNFKIENGVRIPIVQDGSILWSQGIVSEPPKGLSDYEISFNGSSPGEHLYVLLYRYDPAVHFGYAYLPGKGEEWYDVNVHWIYRAVEGHWFRTSSAFDQLVEPLVEKAKSIDRK